MAYLIGVDVGGTNLRVGVVHGMNVIYEKRSHADFSGICQHNRPLEACKQIVSTTSKLLREVMLEYPDVQSVGIGFPGFINPDNGVVIQSPNLPGLSNVDLASQLTESLGIPVIVENDALAAAYGEFRLHPHELDNLIYLGLGTGVGGGLIYGSKPFAGQHGIAMEAGHIIVEPHGRLCGCGNRGCMEQYASATGISKTYLETTGKSAHADEIAQLAQSGDIQAQHAYHVAGTALAQALAHIVKVVDVGCVVIGGGVSQAWPLMQEAFEHQLAADLIPVLKDKVKVSISQSGDQAGIIGAALLAEPK